MESILTPGTWRDTTPTNTTTTTIIHTIETGSTVTKSSGARSGTNSREPLFSRSFPTVSCFSVKVVKDSSQIKSIFLCVTLEKVRFNSFLFSVEGARSEAGAGERRGSSGVSSGDQEAACAGGLLVSGASVTSESSTSSSSVKPGLGQVSAGGAGTSGATSHNNCRNYSVTSLTLTSEQIITHQHF